MTAPAAMCLGCGETGVPCACDRDQLTAIVDPPSPWCPRCLRDRGDPDCCTPAALARIIRIEHAAKPCGCLVGEDCGCSSWVDAGPVPEIVMGTATYGRRDR